MQETESGVKYFVSQALGSIVLLLSISVGWPYGIILVGFILKAGMAPFHFWFPAVISGSNWVVVLILLTWQKVMPLLFIVVRMEYMGVVVAYFLGVMNAIVGGLGGFNQTIIRPLIAYSSIGHIGWIIVAGVYSDGLFLFYFAIYVFISISIVLTIILIKFNTVGLNKGIKRGWVLGIFVAGFLSLGGVPPFLGFFPKWALLVKINFFVVRGGLILGSLMNLYYYLNICFSCYVLRLNYFGPEKFNGGGYVLSIVFILRNFGLPIIIYLLYALIILN